MRPGTIVALVVLAAAPAQAFAQRATAPNPLDPAVVTRGMDQLAGMIARGVFQQADVNRDGMLTRSEAVGAGAQFGLPIGSDPRAWAAIDLNRDGFVVERELADALRAVHARTARGLRPF